MRVWAYCAIAVAIAALAGAYPAAQHGMRGTYFRSDNWTGESVTRVDPRPSDVAVALALGPGQPDKLSVSWIASLAVDRDDTYQVRVVTTARCRLTIDKLLAVEPGVGGVPTVALKPGVYTLAIQCSTGDGRLRLGVFFDTANVDPRPLSSAIVFPAAITLGGFRRLAAIERVQHLLLVFAAGGALLLAIDWAFARGRFGWLLLVASAAATAAVHYDWPWWLRGPSMQEWQWGYEPGPFERPFFWAVAFGAAVLALMGLAATSWARRAPRRAALVLAGAGAIAGLGFQLALLDTSPGGWRQSLVMGAWSNIGYLRSAALVDEMPIGAIVRDYPAIMPRLAFKATTHPPGGTLMFRALMGAARRIGLRGIEANPVFGPPTTASAAPVTSVALAGALAWAASASLTVLPIALAAWTLSRDPLHAALVGLLWLFLPSAAVMSPSLDQLQTLLVAWAFALLLFAQAAPRYPRLWAGVAGAIAAVALFFSFGAAPMLATALLMAGVRLDSPAGRARYLVTAPAFIAGALLTSLVPVVVFGFPAIATLTRGLEAHRVFTVTRSYALWFRYNLLDYAVWIGATTLVAFAATLLNRASSIPWRLAIVVLLGVLVSNLSGTARGEVGRLWMPFMPLMFVAAWTRAALKTPRDAIVAGAAMLVFSVAISLHWKLWFFVLE